MSLKLAPLGAASSPIQPIPALDVEELLDEAPWKERALYPHERTLLRKAIAFLDKVRAGKEIVRLTATKGTIIPDVVSLDAYEYTRNAMENTPFSSPRGFQAREQRIDQAYEVIATILQDEEAAKSLSEDKRIATRQLFETIARYSSNRGLNVPLL